MSRDIYHNFLEPRSQKSLARNQQLGGEREGMRAWERRVGACRPSSLQSALMVNQSPDIMPVEQTKEVLEKCFVYVHQHGGDDVT